MVVIIYNKNENIRLNIEWGYGLGFFFKIDRL